MNDKDYLFIFIIFIMISIIYALFSSIGIEERINCKKEKNILFILVFIIIFLLFIC